MGSLEVYYGRVWALLMYRSGDLIEVEDEVLGGSDGVVEGYEELGGGH